MDGMSRSCETFKRRDFAMEGFRKIGTVLALALLSGPFAGAVAAEILFDHSLMPLEKKIIRQDLERLGELRPEAFEFQELENRSQTLQAIKTDAQTWLRQRVRYLVGPLNRPDLVNTKTNVVMRNLGAFLAPQHWTGTNSVRFQRSKITVTSPQVGLLQFMQSPSAIRLNPTKEASDLVNQIFRLAALFHDARHSDGSSEHAGIPHKVCPLEHEFAGLYQCDDYIDASFGVEIFAGRAMLKQFREQLDVADQKLIADWLSRKKKNIVGNKIYD